MMIILTCSQVCAYAVKVYDQWGNRLSEEDRAFDNPKAPVIERYEYSSSRTTI